MARITDPENRAIARAAWARTVLEITAIVLVGVAVLNGAVRLSEIWSGVLEGPHPEPIVLIVFLSAYAIVIWFLARKPQGSWTDDLKIVVPLEDFLQGNPATNVLAPNLDSPQRADVIAHLEKIRSRAVVKEVLVGILADEGNASDRILIKTYAPREVTAQWEKLLGAESQPIMALRYMINGKRRRVRSLMFTWD